MTVAGDLIDVLTAAIEQAGPEQRARLRAALDLDPVSALAETTAAVYTPATLAAELGRTPRAIRGAINRGELDAVKRGRGWIIGADAVERWTAVDAPRRPRAPRRARARRGPDDRGPMARALT